MRLVHRNVVTDSSMIGFPLVIVDSERDMPGFELGLLCWQTSALTTELQEVIQFITFYITFPNNMTYNKLGRLSINFKLCNNIFPGSFECICSDKC